MEQAARPESRNEVFQKLKPCCVKISQVAIREPESPAAQRDLLDLSNQVLAILTEQVKQDPRVLDDKLAEYVFFPLYHIFRQLDLFSMLLVENCLKCLNILILHGWKTKMQPKMAQQILSLLTFIIDGVPGSEDNKRSVPEETVLESLRGLTALFDTVKQSPSIAAALTEPDAIPALGHGITVMLDNISKGATDGIQQEALRSVQAVYTGLRDQAALANFLPGTMSSLSKALSTPNRFKSRVLADCLSTVSIVLTRVLSDMRTRCIQAKTQNKDLAKEDEKNRLLSPEWLKATTGQVKVALSTMMKLRTHDTLEVQKSLRHLCVKLLDECHTTLADCASFLVETAMVLDNPNSDPGLAETNLRDLISIYPELADKAKEGVHSWMISLPRVMQSGDEDIKRVALHNLSRGIHLLQELNIESATLEDTISDMLRDSTVALMNAGRSSARISTSDAIVLSGETSSSFIGDSIQHAPVLLAHESQKGVRAELTDLLKVIGSHSDATQLSTSMLGHVRGTGSTNQLAAFWLCFELVKATHAESAIEAEVMDISAFADSGDDIELVFQDLYSFSTELLDAHAETEDVDWRLEALALEITAYAAKRSGLSFRPELIDVLFPIVTFLGTNNDDLRSHAIVTLNSIARNCGYRDVSQLIIENVDYMVNSVALKLNSLDISPASTQVLTMMIRLTGPRLVPYLDDVVESIFAALENYHGYHLFVESLFTVLKELVDQSVRSEALLLEDQKKSIPDHAKKAYRPEGLSGLMKFLERRNARLKYEEEESRTKKAAQGYPTAPWKDKSQEGDEQNEEEEEAPPPEPEKPPNSVTYQLLLRITMLTQHYLTSPTPKLRRSLLELLSTASPALAADEEAFLPLVNAVWPVIVSRLYDPETFVAVEACHALSALCSAAGDFLSSRFETEWSDSLKKWCQKVKQQVLQSGSHTKTSTEGATKGFAGNSKIMIPTASGGVVEAKSSTPGRDLARASTGSLGQHSSPVRMWEAVVKLLTALVTYVRVTDEMFDDILDILVEVMERSTTVRQALDNVNADAVWLARYERGHIEAKSAPQMEGVDFVQMEEKAR